MGEMMQERIYMKKIKQWREDEEDKTEDRI